MRVEPPPDAAPATAGRGRTGNVRLDWARVDTLVLDMDGTLLDLWFDNLVWNERLPARVAARRGLAPDAVRDSVRATLDAARGTLDYYCFEHWSRTFDLSMAEVEADVEAHIALRAGAAAFLHGARRRVSRMVLATNAHPHSLARKLRVTGIAASFDYLVSSHDIGFPKEDARYWPRLAAHVGLVADRSAFIDDNAAVLRAARAFGIAQVFGVARPDSRGAPLYYDEFPAIESLERLLA